MTVYIRPWLQLWRTIPLQFFTLLELEDVIVVSAIPFQNQKLGWMIGELPNVERAAATATHQSCALFLTRPC